MSDEEKHLPGGGVRRIGRKDRKKSIETRGPLFPPEEEFSFEAEDVEEEGEEKPPAVVTPPEERFPPLPVTADQQQTRQAAPRRRSTLLPNLVAILFLIATLAAIAVFDIIWMNPYTPLNPLAPPTPLPVIITTTPLPATSGPPPTPGPTASFTPLPPEEILGTPAGVIEPPATFTPSVFPFTLAENGVVYAPNGNGEGCNWSSIAGSVTDLQGQPLNGYGVRVRGQGQDETVYSGSAITFGPGGFELFLNGTPQAGDYTVQLLSPDDAPLSDEYPVSTRATCEENVAIVSFVQNRTL